ncbi:MAG: HAMP domain-containing protein, partial [Trebonia sp.]
MCAMAEDMADEADRAATREASSRRSPLGALRRLSDRTPLRTKLITAVLVLVIMALAAISVASVAMLRNYVTTQHDTELQNSLNVANKNAVWPFPGTSGQFTHSQVILATQQPGQQVGWAPPGSGYGGPAYYEPLPRLPTAEDWPGAAGSRFITTAALSGSGSWRVLGESINYPTATGTIPEILIVAIPLGNISAMTNQLALFDVAVGGAIVVVLAAVAIGVVRANLRPLDDIELTAGQIAAGHLDHRVPEGDPRTEIGSLSRSLNAMLAHVERAFHA